MGAVMLILGNLLADLALSVVDPRIRLQELN
jgi:peptide/nickel transport system permease protein